MNNFIEQNKKLLLFYYRAARIGGWIFVSLAILAGIGHSIALVSRMGNWNDFSEQQYCGDERHPQQSPTEEAKGMSCGIVRL